MKTIHAVSAALLVAVPALAQQPQRITCSSQPNGQQQVCPADTRDGVLLVREAPGSRCRQGSSWSYDRQGITVSNGCSADFLVSGRSERDRNDNGYGRQNGPQNNGYNNGGAPPNGGYNNGANGTYTNNGQHQTGPAARVFPAIPQGTQIAVQLTQDVRLADLNQGDYVAGTLANDLNVGGTLIASAGSPVQAKVRSVQGAPLDLRLDSVTGANGQTYPLQTTSVHSVRDAVSTPGNGRTGFGAVLGSVLDAGVLQSGTVFNFRVTALSRPVGGN